MRGVPEGAKVPGLGRCPDLGGPDKGGLSVSLENKHLSGGFSSTKCEFGFTASLTL